MNEDFLNFTNIDRIIHEPARLMITTILYSVESADFLYLQKATDLTKGNLSSHLAKLEIAGYVNIEKTYKGKLPLTICRLSEEGRHAYKSYKRQLSTFMEHMRGE